MAVDINDQKFQVPLKRDGQYIMCKLARRDFGRQRQAWWKGQQVDELAICRLHVEFSHDPDNGGFPEDLQVCVDDTGSGLPTRGTGREVADQVDLRHVKGWIEKCRSHHGDACETPSWLENLKPASGLRVIDVVDQKIVPAMPGCRYLALSYVWGESTLVLTRAAALKSNIARLGEEGGVATLNLPQTIRDAMALTKGLGERYLWVDALCIVQDDLEDVQRQTAAMDSVFSGAALTIVAAAGDDSDHGLPGLRAGSRSNLCRKFRLTEKVSLLTIDDDQLCGSTWKRRGWTFQEEVLSRRMLFFTPTLVSWKCDLDEWNEETILEPKDLKDDFVCRAVGPSSRRFSLQKLGRYISDYSQRTLSYGSDILPAFQGVMNRYEATTGERLHWGLNYRIIDMGSSLMWRLDALGDNDERPDLRKLQLDDRTTIHMRYPTWSWMHWRGYVLPLSSALESNAIFGVLDCSVIRPELDFYRLMSDGRVELLAPRNQPIPAGVPDESLGRFTRPPTRLWKGLTAIDGPVLINPDNKTPDDDDGGLVQEITHAQPDLPGRPIPVYDTGRLVFRTSHARIKTSSVFSRQSQLGDHVDLHLQLPSRVVAGSDDWHHRNEFNSFHMTPRTSRRLFGRCQATRELVNDGASRLLSYVVVGENYAWEQRAKKPRFRDPQRPAFLNVLIIEWVNEEKGMARRIGTAVFPEPEWMALDRDWRLIILE